MLHGSLLFVPVSSSELTEWIALWELEAHEREKAQKEAEMKAKRGRR